jgi:hypothetical protein
MEHGSPVEEARGEREEPFRTSEFYWLYSVPLWVPSLGALPLASHSATRLGLETGKTECLMAE